MFVSLSFPEEVPIYCCRIMFKKYVRPRPGVKASQNFDGIIRLPLPSSLQDQFNMDVGDVTLDILGNTPSDVLMAGKSKMEAYANEIRAGKGALAFIKDASLQAAAIMPGVSDSIIGKLAQAETGMVRNPHHTSIFNGVKLKGYSFTWKMSPRSQAEAIALENIITNIKGFMHPRIIGGGFALEYPYLAELSFNVGDNNILPNVKTSFITGFTVNSSAGGTPAFYKDGKSAIVEMNISFQEINIQTRDDFVSSTSTSGP